MKHDLTIAIPLFITFAGLIWQASDLKNQIEKRIDTFFVQYNERKDFVDYQLHGLNEKLDHKFQRCMDEIKYLKEEIKNLERDLE